jgi:hypothetical protein
MSIFGRMYCSADLGSVFVSHGLVNSQSLRSL